MTDHSPDETTPKRQSVRDAGATLLAAGGIAAAFGAASCCALPMLLGSFGLGSAWLIAVAWLAAPHRLALLGLAIVCLGGAGGLLLWRRRCGVRDRRGFGPCGDHRRHRRRTDARGGVDRARLPVRVRG
jgi:hypothetical protein